MKRTGLRRNTGWVRKQSKRIKPIGRRARRYASLRQLAREVVILRDGEKCRRCPKTRYIQCAHIYPEGKYRAMAHELDNLILLCVGCHRFWWHLHPTEAAAWIVQVLGQEHMDRLLAMSQMGLKTRPAEAVRRYLEEWKAYYGGSHAEVIE